MMAQLAQMMDLHRAKFQGAVNQGMMVEVGRRHPKIECAEDLKALA
jgi:hypothetical protein